jgi:hypothetical protein
MYTYIIFVHIKVNKVHIVSYERRMNPGHWLNRQDRQSCVDA